jgi:hypothetical protein
VSRKRSQKNLENLFSQEDSQAAGFFETEARAAPQRAARVVVVPLSQCLPDRFQARVILPPELKRQFYSGELDCYDTASSLLSAAAEDPGLANQIEALVALGENILDLGQIEPATGSWLQTEDGQHYFAIEVGERRFWSLALTAVQRQLAEEPTLQVIEESHFSRERQISENIQREGNTAVDRARAIAGLILLEMEIEPELSAGDDMDYFRQVLAIKRLPNNTWPPLEKRMQLSRQVMERHLQILSLPTDLIYQAKLYNVPEGRLREILAAPTRQQRDLLLLAIQDDLTARELRERAEQTRPAGSGQGSGARLSAHQKAASRLRSFVKLVQSHDFQEGYEAAAAEYSVGTQEADDLLEAAGVLEKQAEWLRKMYKRRQ